MTTDTEMRGNQTAQDAFLRVLDAKMGCLAGATDEFIRAFEHELHKLLETLREERWRRIREARIADELAAEENEPTEVA